MHSKALLRLPKIYFLKSSPRFPYTFRQSIFGRSLPASLVILQIGVDSLLWECRQLLYVAKVSSDFFEVYSGKHTLTIVHEPLPVPDLASSPAAHPPPTTGEMCNILAAYQYLHIISYFFF